MANISLEEVVLAIKEGNQQQEVTTKSVDDLTNVFRRYFKDQKNQRGDALETSRESRRGGRRGGIAAAIQQNKEDTSSLGLPMITPIVAALGAWMADLDAYLRALRPDVLLKPVVKFFDLLKTSFTGLINFVTEIKNIRLPEITFKMPRIQFLDDAGKAIGDFLDYKIKLPALQFIDNAGKAIGDFLDYKIKLPVLQFMDDAGKAITEFKLKVPKFQFIDDAGKLISETFDIKLPESVKNFFNMIGDFFKSVGEFSTGVSEKLVLPEGVKNFFSKVTGFFSGIADWFKGIEASIDLKPFLDPIKNALGFADEAGEAGSGLLGFFGKIKGFLGVVLKPIGVVTRILGGPFVQGFLSLLDFVKGFADAFGKQETTYDEFGNVVEDTRGLGSRIMDGLEGGVKEFIKGIADAIDLLFLDLPGWILGKLGFENVSKYLMDLNIGEMVDPVWNWIKNIPKMIMDLIPTAEQLKQFVINTIAALPGGYYVLKAIGVGGAELDFAKKNADLEEAKAQRQEEISKIGKSLAGEDQYGMFTSEASGRESSRKKLKELQEEIAQLEKERDAAGRAAGIVNAQTTTTDASTNVQNNTINAESTPNPFDAGLGIRGFQ